MSKNNHWRGREKGRGRERKGRGEEGEGKRREGKERRGLCVEVFFTNISPCGEIHSISHLFDITPVWYHTCL